MEPARENIEIRDERFRAGAMETRAGAAGGQGGVEEI